ncbi:14345_t:CDS:1, partial [Ambispora leptoticha]
TNSTPGLISLTSSTLPSLPTLHSFKLLYNQLKFYDNQLQIDYQEILAFIHINNHLLVSTTLPPQPQLNIPSYEVQLIQQTVNSPTYQN